MVDPQMVAVYRHDAHKMRGQSHQSAPDEWLGIDVNAEVPYTADGNAAAMSRPKEKPKQLLPGHETHYRRSLITGSTIYDADSFSLQTKRDTIKQLLTGDDAQQMHKRWLQSDVVAGFNESVFCPYTSLKYHTLLVGALVDCYRNDMEFDDLGLYLRTDGYVTPYRTVFKYEGDKRRTPFTLTIDAHARGESSKLASYPMRNFASVWNRMPEHPWDRTDRETQWIDSNLRRIQAWSTGLQYLENTLTNGVEGNA